MKLSCSYRFQCHQAFISITTEQSACSYMQLRKNIHLNSRRRLSAREGLIHATTQRENISSHLDLPPWSYARPNPYHMSHRFQYYSFTIDQAVQNSNKNITVRIGNHDTASDFVKNLRGKYLHLQRENWPPKG